MPRYQVCDGVTLSNPIGDGRDYHGGASIELSDDKGKAWVAKGWVKESVPHLPAEPAWSRRRPRS
jgi:hypothetical protein